MRRPTSAQALDGAPDAPGSPSAPPGGAMVAHATPPPTPARSPAARARHTSVGARGYLAVTALALACLYAVAVSLSVFQGFAAQHPQLGGRDGADADAAPRGGGGRDSSAAADAASAAADSSALRDFSSLMYRFYAAGHSMIAQRLVGGGSSANASGSDGGGGGSPPQQQEWVERNPDTPPSDDGSDGEAEAGPFRGAAAAAGEPGEEAAAAAASEGGSEEPEAGGAEGEAEGGEEGGEGEGEGDEEVGGDAGAAAAAAPAAGSAAGPGTGGGNASAASVVGAGGGGRRRGRGRRGRRRRGGGRGKLAGASTANNHTSSSGSSSSSSSGGGGDGAVDGKAAVAAGDGPRATAAGGSGKRSGKGGGDAPKGGKGAGGGSKAGGDAPKGGKGGGGAKAPPRAGGSGSVSPSAGPTMHPQGPVVAALPDTPELAAERARYGGPYERSHPLGPLDVQILRDLHPWRRRGGFSFEDVLATRAQKAPLIDQVTNFSSGLITCVIKNNVAYMLASELPGIDAQYGVGSKGKIRDMLAMLTSIARVYKLPDAWFLWNVHPWPLLRTRPPAAVAAAPPSIEHTRFAANSDSATVAAPRGLAPVLSLCKTDGEIDVLYPNMYFQSPNYWWRVTRSIERSAETWAFGARKAKMWWRGASGWTWPAAAPRVLTLARWADKPWADLAFTSPWRSQLRQWARERVPWYRSLPQSVASIPSGPTMRTPMEVVAHYKYALHLPGSYGATYSRTLQFLLWTGTAVFFYDCPYYEFYYHHLGAWEQFVPVNVSSLGDRVKWANANPARVERIAAASYRFARERLTAAHFALYWKQLLDLYAGLQRFKVKLPEDACTCWPVARRSQPNASRPRGVPRDVKRCPWVCDFGSRA